MLKSKLLSWSYYERKIPLYILNAYGVQEFFKIMVNFLINQDSVEDDICKAFDIYDKNYKEFMNNHDSSNYNYNFLDLIASLYGVSREFGVEYRDNLNRLQKKDLYLTNEELLTLIKVRIIQNNFNGTYEETRKFYDNINLPVYLIHSTNPAEAYVFIASNNPDGTKNNMTDNMRAMIFAGLFTIKSMGITYHVDIRDLATVAIWDSENDRRKRDAGVWS